MGQGSTLRELKSREALIGHLKMRGFTAAIKRESQPSRQLDKASCFRARRRSAWFSRSASLSDHDGEQPGSAATLRADKSPPRIRRKPELYSKLRMTFAETAARRDAPTFALGFRQTSMVEALRLFAVLIARLQHAESKESPRSLASCPENLECFRAGVCERAHAVKVSFAPRLVMSELFARPGDRSRESNSTRRLRWSRAQSADWNSRVQGITTTHRSPSSLGNERLDVSPADDARTRGNRHTNRNG